MKAVSSVLAAYSMSHASTRSDSARPNVILVMTDDQGYGEFSCHGNPIAHTPNIDRLASESVRLTSCLGSSGIAQFRFISVR
jgi:arylsulfatase A-like enzyme